MVSRYGRRQTLSRGQASRKLLIDESPLQVLPSLAVTIGLTEAIVLQQVHYWLGRSDHVHDGRRWIYRTQQGWKREIPWWSVATIKRALATLQERGLLIKGNYNDRGFDRTSWWTIDYEVMARLEAATLHQRAGQAAPMERRRMHRWSGSTRTNQYQRLRQRLLREGTGHLFACCSYGKRRSMRRACRKGRPATSTRCGR